jgi:hypothetical protein
MSRSYSKNAGQPASGEQWTDPKLQTLGSSPAAVSPQDDTESAPRIKISQSGTAVKLQPDCKNIEDGTTALMKVLGAEDLDFM